MCMLKLNLNWDRYVFARPSGKRCFVVASNGTTISRQRNGSVLHHFPSALPNGARTRDVSGSGQSYSILDCIFHEVMAFFFQGCRVLCILHSNCLLICHAGFRIRRRIKLTMLLTCYAGGVTLCMIVVRSSGFFG